MLSKPTFPSPGSLFQSPLMEPSAPETVYALHTWPVSQWVKPESTPQTAQSSTSVLFQGAFGWLAQLMLGFSKHLYLMLVMNSCEGRRGERGARAGLAALVKKTGIKECK